MSLSRSLRTVLASLRRTAPFSAWLLWLSLVLSSAPYIASRISFVAVGAHALACGVLVFFLPRRVARLTRSGSRRLLVGLLLLLSAVALIVYPLADAREHRRLGSDRDDAIEIALDSVASGQSPYRSPTYLGNPISPLPGALFLALPFWLVHAVPFISLAWLVVLAITLSRTAGPAAALLGTIWIAVSQPAIQDLLTGGDLLASAVFAALAIETLEHDRWQSSPWLLGAFAGCALTSRWPTLSIWPLLIAFTSRHAKHTRSVGLGLVLSIVMVLFVLARPETYGPLGNVAKLGLSRSHDSSGFPTAQAIVAFGALAWVGILIHQIYRSGGPRPRGITLTRAAGLALAVPLAALAVLQPLTGGGALLNPLWSYLLLATPLFTLDYLREFGDRSAKPQSTF